jgi:hypothetical protein
LCIQNITNKCGNWMWRFCRPRCQDKSWMAWQIIWHGGMYPMLKCCKSWFLRGYCLYLFFVWLSNYLLDLYMVLIAKEMSYLNLWLQLLDKTMQYSLKFWPFIFTSTVLILLQLHFSSPLPLIHHPFAYVNFMLPSLPHPFPHFVFPYS